MDTEGGCPHINTHINEKLLRDTVFFALGAEDTVYRVGSAATGLVIVANLHFSQESDREKI
jgi:hypothetical protein